MAKSAKTEQIKKRISSIAAKLLADGLVASTFTIKKAKYILRNTVSSASGYKIVEEFSADVKKQMVKIRKQKLNAKK